MAPPSETSTKMVRTSDFQTLYFVMTIPDRKPRTIWIAPGIMLKRMVWKGEKPKLPAASIDER